MISTVASFVEEVAATPGGANIRACIQCGVCVAACPAADEMEYPPRKIIALIRAGLRDEVLSSSSMWHCLSCYMCTVRCPRNVRPTELAHTLESLATEHGFRVKGTRTPAMYRSFVNSVMSNGRVYELGMMFRFYLTTNPITALKMLPVAIQLFLHRRLPLRANKASSRQNLVQIIHKFREIRGSQ